jgi:hypothetical protein
VSLSSLSSFFCFWDDFRFFATGITRCELRPNKPYGRQPGGQQWVHRDNV